MKIRRNHVTLIDMMIVMSLIALIAGALAVNLTGSMETGKKFKTETGMKQIDEALTLYLMDHPEALSDISSNWRAILRESPVVKDAKSLEKDGWGQSYRVGEDPNGGILIESQGLTEYSRKNRK